MDLIETIRAAQRGTPGAFEAVARRYQGAAFAVAYARLGEPQRAAEVAQEALLEAWLHLDQLREPAAFAAWLRRITLKQIDRRTRRRRLPVVGLEDGPPLAAAPAADPVEVAWTHAQVHAALAALPAPDREAVALFYLRELSLRELAELLEVPEGTLKKRLHTARRRLRAGLEDAMHEYLDHSRPDDGLTQRIGLFIAARSNDLDAARRLLAAGTSPDAQVKARLEEHRDHYLLVGSSGLLRPLHLAAVHGSLAVAEALLASGADPGAAGPSGWTALHEAARAGHADLCSVLLAAGAPVDARHSNHLTPLHLAAIHGHAAAAEALLAGGADPLAPGRDGLSPVFWAATRGHTALAERLRTAADARATAPRAFYATGIKAIDLLAPVPLGGRVHLLGAYGVGLMVLLGELLFQARGPRPVLLVRGDRFTDAGDFVAFLREAGLEDRVLLRVVRPEDAPEVRAATTAEAVEAAGTGLLLMDHDLARAPDFAAHSTAPATILFFEACATPDAQKPEDGFFRLDGRIRLSAELARAGLYPAISPQSWSRAPITARHAEVAAAAKQALAGPEVPRALRLRAWLSQPFQSVESHNGILGRQVAPEDTLDDAEAILRGDYDAVVPEQLRYLGRAAEVRRGI